MQPSRQVGRTTEIEQGFCQGFQLLQRQGLDPGGGGFAEGAAAAVELAQRDFGFALGLTFLPAPIKKVLRGAGVEQLVGGNAGEQVTRLPSGLGPEQPAQPVGGVSSSSITARASLSWSRLREVSARRNRH